MADINGLAVRELEANMEKCFLKIKLHFAQKKINLHLLVANKKAESSLNLLSMYIVATTVTICCMNLYKFTLNRICCMKDFVVYGCDYSSWLLHICD